VPQLNVFVEQKAIRRLMDSVREDAEELAASLKRRIGAVMRHTLAKRWACVKASVSVRHVSSAAVSALFAPLLPLSEWESALRGVYKIEVSSAHPLLKRVLGQRWNLAYKAADAMAGYVVPTQPVQIFFCRKNASLSMNFSLRQCMWGEEPKDL
jgi:hypothetical protein